MDFNEKIRHKWIRKQLANIPEGESLLDAGTGECPFKSFSIEKGLIYKSQDFCQYDGVGNNKALQTKSWSTEEIDIISDIISIPVKSNSFDNILCSEVLEHIPYPDRAIKEFSRILRNKGKLILTAPFCSQTHFAPFHYCTGFNIYWYEKILSDNNFKLLSYERHGNYYKYLLQEVLRFLKMLYRMSKLSLLNLSCNSTNHILFCSFIVACK